MTLQHIAPPEWVHGIPGVDDTTPPDPQSQAATKPDDLYACPRCQGRGEVDAWIDPFGNVDTVPCGYCDGLGGFVEPEEFTVQAYGSDTAVNIRCTCGWWDGIHHNRTQAVAAGEHHIKAAHS